MATLPNVPAPKNSGLALLADTANEEQGTYHYPVRRRGLPRALLPNWDAIRWLEEESEDDCEIEYQQEETADGLLYTFAYGRIGKSYPRPMFQVINDGAFSGFRGLSGTACPCGDFSRSMYCPDCQELEYDWNRRTWIRPGTAIWYEHHPEDRPTPAPAPQPTAYIDTGARPPGAGTLYDRMIEMFGQPLPSYAEQDRERRRQEASLRGQWIEASQLPYYGTSRCTCEQCRIRYADRRRMDGDPNDGRPGYHYDALTDRWVRDTSDALGDFRAGASEVLDLNLGNLTSVPDALRTSGNYDRWVDRVLGLQDSTIRVEGVFGEGSFTFAIEEDAGGDTRTP